MKLIDRTDQRYGNLVAKKYLGSSYWNCLCDCGKFKKVSCSNLVSGNTKSCGCKWHQFSENALGHKHGYSRHPLYVVWRFMLLRCKDPKNKGYHNYGARGISVCVEWECIDKFVEWMLKNGWEKGLTIERLDNNGNYCPENCVLASMKVQSNNTRRNLYYLFDGRKRTLKQITENLGLNYQTIYHRIKYQGLSLENALFKE